MEKVIKLLAEKGVKICVWMVWQYCSTWSLHCVHILCTMCTAYSSTRSVNQNIFVHFASYVTNATYVARWEQDKWIIVLSLFIFSFHYIFLLTLLLHLDILDPNTIPAGSNKPREAPHRAWLSGRSFMTFVGWHGVTRALKHCWGDRVGHQSFFVIVSSLKWEYLR